MQLKKKNHAGLKKTVTNAVFLLVFSAMLLITPQLLFSREPGLKYFKNYGPIDYGHQPQNWAVLQDPRGVIYVGNHGGLLEFDGVSWRMISIPNYSVRSMAIDEEGTIYIGGNNEFGYLAPDSYGALHYVSLLDYIEKDQRNFGNVWRTQTTAEGIYFCAFQFLFRWDSKQMKVWRPTYPFHTSFTCGGIFFINQEKVGLMRMVEDSLKLIPNGEIFAKKKIYVMASYDMNRMLIGTRSAGFFICDGSIITPFPTGVDHYLHAAQLAHGCRLKSGDFALATRFGGLVITDASGNLKHIFNKESGLLDNNVWYVFEDSRGNLWLALNNGITKIEYASPLSFYDNRINLPGLVLSLARHGQHHDLFVGTTGGLYVLAKGGNFRAVTGLSDMCFDILSSGDSLLTATNNGVFQVRSDSSGTYNHKSMVINSPSTVLFRSVKDRNRVWAGTAYGLASLCLVKKHWTEERKFETITDAISKIVEDKEGNLWCGTLTRGVLKIEFPAVGTIGDSNPRVTRHDISKGLPAGAIQVFWAAGHTMFATQKGLFRFNGEDQTFVPDYTLGSGCAGGQKGRGVFLIAEDKNKNIWFHSESINFQALARTDGTFQLNPGFFLKLPVTQVNAIYPDPYGNATWFASNEGLIRYDTTVKHDEPAEFPTLIRGVVINGRRLIYDSEEFNYKKNTGSNGPYPVIDYKDRNLRFEFAAPFFEAEDQIRYQFFLQGYEGDWSSWVGETRKDYTNLDSGNYTFRVRAINVYGNLSHEATFRFKVLPPWYKTWWSFLLYAFGLFLLIFFIVRWRSGRLKQDKQKLERIVKERTKEVNLQNLQLEEQSEKLKEMDEVKSRFFANISHEFRTPLTLIIGPLEQLIANPGDRELDRKLHLMLRNSQRLLTLINQLLELSKLDSGKMKLQTVYQDIVPFLRGIVDSFASLAVQDELALTFRSEQEEIFLYFDSIMIDDIMCNLIINAVKFTPAGGKIEISIRSHPDKEGKFPSGRVDISVKDTGIGIPAGEISHIFNRFYQARGPGEHERKGSGIGLALTKELTALHYGEIFAHSGEGTEFIVRLPLGDGHLKPDEKTEHPEKSLKQRCPKDFTAFQNADRENDNGTQDEGVTGPDRSEKNIILVVEDSADMRSYIREALDPHFRVIVAKDGEAGIRKAQEIIPDLIISDVLMPKVDGYELFRALKENVNTSHVPVILLTAKASEENVIAGLKIGADDYITKPFNTKILCARINNLIELRSQMQQKMQRRMKLQPDNIKLSPVDDAFIKELQEVIDKNLDDSEFNVEALCKKMQMSRATMYRKIEALTGESTSEFIRSHRLKRAADLLKSGFGSITEVAFEVGFASRTYFTKCFKEKFHQLPSAFQSSESE